MHRSLKNTPKRRPLPDGAMLLTLVTLWSLGSLAAATAVFAQSLSAKGDPASYWSAQTRALVLADDSRVPLPRVDQALDLRVDGQRWSLLGTRRLSSAAPALSSKTAVVADSAPTLDEVVWLRSSGDTVIEARLPPGDSARTTPVLLADDEAAISGRTMSGAAIAMAWLEGPSPRAQEVWTSSWNGERFEAPERLVVRGPGSQVALRGAMLSDGRSLLVWSGFDGQDTEIQYLLRDRHGNWGTPARLAPDNAVPDVRPTVMALAEGGALVAWATFDSGEYRVVGSRFDGTGFDEPRHLAPRGTVWPTFDPATGLLVVQEAWPRAWRIIDWSAGGAGEEFGVRRITRAETPTTTQQERPLVRSEPGGVRLVWEAPIATNRRAPRGLDRSTLRQGDLTRDGEASMEAVLSWDPAGAGEEDRR